VEQVAKKAILLGRGSLIAKIDIKSTYCLVPVAPVDRHCLGVSWKGNTYIDAKLPCGLRSEPKIFKVVADALEWCIALEEVNIILMILLSWAHQAQHNAARILRVCSELGIPLAPKKQAGPYTVIDSLVLSSTHPSRSCVYQLTN